MLYLDKSRYRIAIDSVEDIRYMEYTRRVNYNVPSKQAGVGTADERPLTGDDKLVNAYDEAEEDEKIDQNSLWESPTKLHRY